MKMAPLLRAFAARTPPIAAYLVHTGQHYDVALNERILADLHMPKPDINLEVGAGTPSAQTADVMRRFEPVVDRISPSCVLVVGDVTSTLACALVAAKKGIPVVHVEAGLRSHDRSMPEELNRILTDQLAEILYTTERSALDNLVREGIGAERVRFVGNVMIDSLREGRSYARPVSETLARSGMAAPGQLNGKDFALVTLHRPSNVDGAAELTSLLDTLLEVSCRLPVVFVLHPRTKANLERFAMLGRFDRSNVIVLPPQGYLEMLGLMSAAKVVLTDSGGMQEETTALGIPCITLRENTERPITVEQGTNTVVGSDGAAAVSVVDRILAGDGKSGRIPELWDGKAALRIADDLGRWLQAQACRSLQQLKRDDQAKDEEHCGQH